MNDNPMLPVIQTGQSAPERAGGNETVEMSRDAAKTAELEPVIIAALKTVFDPEIPVNIYDLGLVYDIVVDASGAVGIRMTLTAPACPAAQFLPGEVKKKTADVPGVTGVKVDIVWEPPWDRDRMSDAAKLQLGMF
jgi:FeS assembly SUF system protein